VPKAPKVALPTLTLIRSHDLGGGGVSDPDEVVYSGDPNKDPVNAFDADGKPLLTWKSQTRMKLTVNQALALNALGKKHARLPWGVWDLEVKNADGHSAESKKALAVVDKPNVTKLSPGLTCLDQGSRTVTLSGETFLRNGDGKAVLDVEGVDTPF